MYAHPGISWIAREDAVVFFDQGAERITCAKLLKGVMFFRGIHYTRDQVNFAERAEWRRLVIWENETSSPKPRMLARIGEFSPQIPCDLDLESAPDEVRYRGELWSEEIAAINAWHQNEW